MLQRIRSLFQSGLALWLIGANVSAHATVFTFTELSAPGATSTSLWDVNNSGQMVGYTTTGDISQAFLYASGAFTSLGPAGAANSFALGISDTGIVVGSYSLSTTGPQTGFLYSGSSYTSFAVAGATDTFLRGISPDGRYVTGYYTTATDNGIGFVYDNTSGLFTSIGTGGSNFTIVQGVTNAGIAVGGVSDPISGSRSGFTYDTATATRTDFDLAGATRTAFRAIDESGLISGWYLSAGQTYGFTGFPGAVESIAIAGATDTFIEGSNNSGTLVGNYYTADGLTRAFYATPTEVPAPQTLSLAVLGLLGIAVSFRLRRRSTFL